MSVLGRERGSGFGCNTESGLWEAADRPCELQERAETLGDSSASVSWKWNLVVSSWLNWLNWVNRLNWLNWVSIANPATLLQA